MEAIIRDTRDGGHYWREKGWRSLLERTVIEAIIGEINDEGHYWRDVIETIIGENSDVGHYWREVMADIRENSDGGYY